MAVSVRPCKCQHEYQDKAYGEGRRVHTPMKNGQWCCTVCTNVTGSIKEAGDKKTK